MWSDLVYSSDNTAVDVYWSGFSDVESGIASYRIAVGRGIFNVARNVMEVQTEHFMPFQDVGFKSSWRKATFSFVDGTNVVISVAAMNQAGLGTMSSTNGFTIDMYVYLSCVILFISLP